MDQPGLQFFLLLLYVISLIFFLLTLQNTLKVISLPNRRIPPPAVWLMLVPFFGFVWQLVVISRLADSIKAECLKLNISSKESRPTLIPGIVYSFSFLIYLMPAFKTAGLFVVLITWILYWFEVNKYKKLLEANKINDI